MSKTLIGGFLYTLFYPWLKATSLEAYRFYTTTKLYEDRIQTYGIDYAMRVYTNEIVSFWKLAWKKSWAKIIFIPWTIPVHSDFYETKE